jgi:hypothetical protein
VRAEDVPLSQLIELVDGRCGTDFHQADPIVGAAVTGDGLRQAAAVIPEDGFELVLQSGATRKAKRPRPPGGSGLFVEW